MSVDQRRVVAEPFVTVALPSVPKVMMGAGDPETMGTRGVAGVAGVEETGVETEMVALCDAEPPPVAEHVKV